MMFDLPFDLPAGWEVKTVEQLIGDGVIEKPLDGNHGGIHPKASDYVETGVPFVMASDLDAGRVDFNNCKFISSEQAAKLRKGFSKAGDILISHKATIGRTAIVQESEYDFIMLTPQVTYYRVKNPAKLNNVYLKAYFDSSFFKSILNLWAGAGSTRAYLGITGQLKLPVILPPIDCQGSIANQVGLLNEKIELNRQTNQTLEHIAQALFKSWFVDFEPTRAKIAAKQAGQDPERAAMATISGKTVAELDQLDAAQLAQLKMTAALFPSGLFESELGEVPEGWSPVEAKDQIDVLRGFSYKGKGLCSEGEGVPMHNLNSVLEGGGYKYAGLKFYNLEYKEKFKTKKGDVVVANTEQGHNHLLIGYGTMIPSFYGEGFFSHHLYRVRPKESANITPEFLQQLFKFGGFVRQVQGFTNGTTVNMLPIAGLEMPKFVCPPKPLAELFSSQCNSILAKAESNYLECLDLEKIRDTLLPKLLSGELSPTQAEVA